MLVIFDENTNSVHLMDLTWPEIFALGASAINTAMLTEDPDVHDLLDPLLDGIDAATEHALNVGNQRAESQF